MGSNQSLRLDYKSAKNQIKKLQDSIDDCKELQRTVRNLYSDIPDCWKGASADAAVGKMQEWESDFTNIISDMQSLKTQINKKIERLNQADQNAQSGGGGSR
ncbi:MAG: WXG100 family type VII secretion target [Clostridia bacterium]|nr:WXG100 family type VII secretion target [Clostridia bacterium]